MEDNSSQEKMDEERRQMDIWRPDARIDRRTKKYRQIASVESIGQSGTASAG